ncbi:hypothetical protein [Streptomyces stelliscabiei]|uniref:Uncharacterized protein n=1 Tax=Streptomyces stelliscabiei TaxID=146820 RepID=A0A8I0TVW0_9ACTN|nr:hypothetical protein [Streptomyces stelliscabiei]KND29663.1 hypothetical protein IQ64_41945 [Streptomyces stelliscabiei]MBE1599753.1 hypothetical protein [Streptomyces stelliscabiei]MDX2519410.1 hypothetical protein [Streptomyces stelliscabiei]MDX2549661.1 hypothetical protein [Streptomyces stelliscabiei]MDX2616091.1 hypothetical protein [Streptomyces stelliscabiei]
MEQATQSATPTAPVEAEELVPAGATLLEAHSVAGRIITQLATFPRDIDLKREMHGQYSVQIYWSSDYSGVAAFAAWADQPWHMTPTESGEAVYAEARAIVDNVAVWAWTILTREEAATAEQLLTAPRVTATAAACDAEPAPAPVPLGESPVAQAQPDLYAQSTARYVASLGGSVVALVPAVEAATDDDGDTVSLTAAHVEPGHMVVSTPAAGGDL